MNTPDIILSAEAATLTGTSRRADPTVSDRRLTLIRFAFVLFAFTLPFEAVNLGQWSRVETLGSDSAFITLPKLVGYFFSLVTLIDWKRCYARRPWALYFFTIYLVWYVLRGVLGDCSEEVLGRVFTRAQMLILLYAGYNLLSEEIIRKAVFISFGCACSLLAMLVLSGVLSNAIVQTTSTGSLERVTGLNDDANTVAAILSLGLISVTALVIAGHRVRWIFRVSGCIAAVCLIAAIVHTGSRGGMLALAGGLVGFALGEKSQFKMIRNIVIGLVSAGCLISFVLTSESTLTRWQMTLYDQNTAGRDVIMGQTLKLIKEKPLFGWGPVTAEHALGKSLGLATRGTHNLILGIFLESGFIGGLPYIFGIVACMAAAWRARQGAAAALPMAMLMVLLITNVSIVWDNQKMHWLVLALALAAAPRFLNRGETRPWQPSDRLSS